VPERLIILAVLAIAVTLAIVATKQWSARRVQAVTDSTPVGTLWEALKETPDGRKTLVTFSSPSCAACHTAQAPAIRKVEEQIGNATLRVIKVDAASQPDVARAFGVVTVPSTVVLGPAGQVVAVNQGFAPTIKLVEQLQRI
jgi:thioredoxin-like negative regulator of GroEL